MKALSILALAAGLLIALLVGSADAAGAIESETMPFLAVSGMNIVTSDSRQVFLRGVNFGNWLLWEGAALAGFYRRAIVFHHYCETPEQMRERIREKGYYRFMHQYQVPVMCSEFGNYLLAKDFERK